VPAPVAIVTHRCTANPSQIKWVGTASKNAVKYLWDIDGTPYSTSTVTVTYASNEFPHVAILKVRNSAGKWSKQIYGQATTPCS
jgi:hypothetical protein